MGLSGNEESHYLDFIRHTMSWQARPPPRSPKISPDLHELAGARASRDLARPRAPLARSPPLLSIAPPPPPTFLWSSRGRPQANHIDETMRGTPEAFAAEAFAKVSGSRPI